MTRMPLHLILPSSLSCSAPDDATACDSYLVCRRLLFFPSFIFSFLPPLPISSSYSSLTRNQKTNTITYFHLFELLHGTSLHQLIELVSVQLWNIVTGSAEENTHSYFVKLVNRTQ